MDINRSDFSFLQNVVRYSALKYFQKKITERCSKLPQRFDSLEEWNEYKAKLVAVLREELPIWQTGDQSACPQTASAELGGNIVLEAIDVYFEDGFYIPVHVYVPKQKAPKRPAVIVCPGYGQRKNSEDIVDLCVVLAKEGMIALAMEYDATGERADRPDFETDINNVTALGQLVGITNVGLRVMSNLAALNYLKNRDDIDSRRVGITGLCQGAIVTWFTAAICEDFAVVAPLCGATTYEAIALEYCNRQGGWSGISPYVFDLLSYADVQHIIAAIAPRPLLAQNNLIDMHWPLSGFEKVKQFSQHIYDLYNSGENCRFILEHGPHAYAGPFISNIVTWFKKFL